MAGLGPRLIYDGDCAFCTARAGRLAARWSAAGNSRPTVVAAQQLGAAELAALGLSRAQVEEAVWWIDEQGRSTSGADAVARALIATGG
ncbi:MAG: DCC1-like thiol-disulfide oxidoreductase family protein, partial [Mycobacteriales bacterium]